VSLGNVIASSDAGSLARRLAPVLGDEGAEAAVHDAMRELGYSERNLTREEQLRLLDWLASRPGLIGTAARRAKHGMELRETAQARQFGEPPTGRMSLPTQTPAASPPAAANMVDGAELVAIFARALGDEKARETIDAECRRLTINPKRLSLASAHMLLDELAAGGGLVAVTARFAKARLSLRR
jgi:hypothetical protein